MTSTLLTVYPWKQENDEIINNKQLQFLWRMSRECVKYLVDD